MSTLPGQGFAFSLYDAGEIWTGTARSGRTASRRYPAVGRCPTTPVTSDGRYYLAGLFGEDGVALLDLWQPEAGVRRILDGYGRGEEPLPVYKMPHYEGWGAAGELLFLPAIGRHELLAVDRRPWEERAGSPSTASRCSPSHPDGRGWVTCIRHDVVQVMMCQPRGRGRLGPQGGAAPVHPRGEQAWISARDDDGRGLRHREPRGRGQDQGGKPSGIFLTARANRIGS